MPEPWLEAACGAGGGGAHDQPRGPADERATAEERRREAEWQTQDDEAATRRAHEAARRVRLVAQAQEADATANAKEMLLRKAWEKEAQTALVASFIAFFRRLAGGVLE